MTRWKQWMGMMAAMLMGKGAFASTDAGLWFATESDAQGSREALESVEGLRDWLWSEYGIEQDEPLWVEFHEEEQVVDFSSFRGHNVVVDMDQLSGFPRNLLERPER